MVSNQYSRVLEPFIGEIIPQRMKLTLNLAIFLLCAPPIFAREASQMIDSISFGDTNSENTHNLTAEHSEIIPGALGQPARRLLPLERLSWEGGHVAFTLGVDPDKQNYATIRLSGSDITSNDLILFCEGKQIGYRHLGDIDLLDIGGERAAFPGRFFYNTTPLPLALTQGKTNLHFEIRSSGPTWGYGNTFEQFQKALVEPTRGIYKLYTHMDGCFIPRADEKQGEAPKNPPARKSPGPEVMEKLKTRVNGEVNNLLKSSAPLNEMQMEFLARAYFVKWTAAYRNPKVIEQVVQGMDALFAAWRENPELVHNDRSTPNPGWFEFGPAGHAVSLLGEKLKPFLDAQINDGADKIFRRTAWSRLLVAGRDWHRHHRRLYTNQTMITDMNIYFSNRGLEVVDPASVLSETEVRHYLYEAVALEPWRDSDGSPNWNVGTNYWQLTAKYLTKELGYVGYYGEVLDWMTSIYNATRPAPGEPGDEKVRQQLQKIANTRAIFRYPGIDEDGNRAMRIEGVVGWRDAGHYPGDVAYAERVTWDASPLYAAAATLDANAIGRVQQMFEDGQFFVSLNRQMAQNNSLRVTAGLLDVPDQYELLKSQPPSAKRLPMSPGQPDFVFSDEEDGVVAIKNGDEILYASLYWRARNAVNFLARVHFTTPTVDRISVVQEAVEFTPSGIFYARPDHINFGFANGGPRFPVEMHSAHAGEKLPIAKIPDGVRFHPGDESVYAGKGDFYTLRYGDYLIGMNMTTDKTFELKPPEGVSEARELVSGKVMKTIASLSVAPRSTVVLWSGTHR
jgi:hypothetical protein